MATLMTVSKVSKVDVGDREEVVCDLTGDASYPAGGYEFSHVDVPFRSHGLAIEALAGRVEDGSGRTVEFDRANGKVLWREPNGAEIAPTTDLSLVTARARVFGR